MGEFHDGPKAVSWEAFRASPVGQAHAGRAFLVACPAQDLCVFAYWGRLDDAELDRLLPLYDAVAGSVLPPYDLLTDVSRIESIERAAFDRLAQYVGEKMPREGANVRRHALVRPVGLVGALSAGFYSLIAPSYPWRDFVRLDEASAWLGRGSALGADFERRIDSLQQATPIIRRLRDYLRGHVQTASVDIAVRAIGVSARSLQRHLRENGASFRHELMRARVEAAQALLLESDAKLDAIAVRVGCSSGSNLGVLFRRVTGETPAQYRLRGRAQALAEKQRRLATRKR